MDAGEDGDDDSCDMSNRWNDRNNRYVGRNCLCTIDYSDYGSTDGWNDAMDAVPEMDKDCNIGVQAGLMLVGMLGCGLCYQMAAT